jgi:hypothetical protein
MIGIRDAVEGALFAVWRMIQDARARRTVHKAEKNRQEILEDMLSGPWEWRSTDKLRNAIGADRKTTTELLLAIGAVRAIDGRDMWHFPAEKRREIRSRRARA